MPRTAGVAKHAVFAYLGFAAGDREGGLLCHGSPRPGRDVPIWMGKNEADAVALAGVLNDEIDSDWARDHESPLTNDPIPKNWSGLCVSDRLSDHSSSEQARFIRTFERVKEDARTKWWREQTIGEGDPRHVRLFQMARSAHRSLLNALGTKQQQSKPVARAGSLTHATRPAPNKWEPIGSPDFVETTDLRATSDQLWLALRRLRKWIMSGVGGADASRRLQEELLWISVQAFEAGLRPNGHEAVFISSNRRQMTRDLPLAVSEHDHPDSLYLFDPERGSVMVLVPPGTKGVASGCGATSDLTEVVGWCERWMNARERQLAEPVAVSVSPAEFRPAIWFKGKIAPRLRMAASKARKTKRVAAKKIDGVVCYRVADVLRWWPEAVPPNQ